MAEAWSPEFAARVRAWCDPVAVLGVDALVDAGIVARADFERASIIVAEEVFVRLCLRDYLPVPGPREGCSRLLAPRAGVASEFFARRRLASNIVIAPANNTAVAVVGVNRRRRVQWARQSSSG